MENGSNGLLCARKAVKSFACNDVLDGKCMNFSCCRLNEGDRPRTGVFPVTRARQEEQGGAAKKISRRDFVKSHGTASRAINKSGKSLGPHCPRSRARALPEAQKTHV